MNDPVVGAGTESPSTPPTLQGRWEAQISRWSKSGLSKSAYSKSAGINYHQMIYWSRKLAIKNTVDGIKQDKSAAKIKSNGFVAASLVPAATALFIRLPNGIEIGGIQEQRLSHVISLVSG